MLLLGALTILILAQACPADTRRDAGRPASADRQFMQEAAAAGRAAVEIGHLATKKASDPEVQQFARHMVNDHETTSKELMQLAKRQGVSLSTEMDPEDKSLLHRLSKLEGAEFDRQYMEAMVNDHREIVAKFEREAQAGRDPEVKSFAERTLPMLRHHLELARATAEVAGATAGRK